MIYNMEQFITIVNHCDTFQSLMFIRPVEYILYSFRISLNVAYGHIEFLIPELWVSKKLFYENDIPIKNPILKKSD